MKVKLSGTQVLFINLDSQLSRRKHIQDLLSRIGLAGAKRISAVQDLSGYVGLLKTQIQILKNYDTPFLLLEDDVNVTHHFKLDFEVPDDADAVYLGTSAWGLQKGKTTKFLRYKKTEIEGVLKIQNMLSAHAILFVNNSFKNKCLEALTRNLNGNRQTGDVIFANLQDSANVYCLDEPFFIQEDFGDAISDAPNWTTSKLSEYPRSFQLGRFGLPLNKYAFHSTFAKMVKKFWGPSQR